MPTSTSASSNPQLTTLRKRLANMPRLQTEEVAFRPWTMHTAYNDNIHRAMILICSPVYVVEIEDVDRSNAHRKLKSPWSIIKVVCGTPKFPDKRTQPGWRRIVQRISLKVHVSTDDLTTVFLPRKGNRNVEATGPMVRHFGRPIVTSVHGDVARQASTTHRSCYWLLSRSVAQRHRVMPRRRPVWPRTLWCM